jgi:hypothetical protein
MLRGVAIVLAAYQYPLGQHVKVALQLLVLFAELLCGW